MSERALLDAIESLRAELQVLRKGQHKLTKMVYELRHEVNHRVSSTHDEMSALVKASHAELSSRFDAVALHLEEHRHRIREMEQDFDEIFEGH